MRAAIYLMLAVALVPVPARSAAPDSFVGTWQLDLVRTMAEHIERMASVQPDLVSAEALESARTSLTEGGADQPLVKLTITDTEIVSQGPGAEPTIVPYTLIGGNSRLAILEYVDDEGHEAVSRIRLVDGGIAVESMDCRENPDFCERQKVRALQQLENSQSVTSTAVETDGMILSASGEPAQLIESGEWDTPDYPSQPRWFYFKPVE